MAYVFSEEQLVSIRRHCGYAPRREQQTVFYDTTNLEYTLTILTDEEAAPIVNEFLPQLDAARQEIYDARANLKNAKIAIIERNQAELQDRRAEYRSLRFDLVKYLGVPSGPFLNGSATLRWVK